MKTNVVIAGGVGLLVGVAIAASLFLAYSRMHPAPERASNNDARVATAAPASVATTTAPSPPGTAWALQEHTDPISGFHAWYVSGLSHEASTVLLVRCASDSQLLDVQLLGNQLYATPTDTNWGKYIVSYRFDDRPGVQSATWYGSNGNASPVGQDGESFAGSMASAHKLVMQIWSTVMSDAVDGIGYQHFDLDGFAPAVAKLRTHCVPPQSGQQAPGPNN